MNGAPGEIYMQSSSASSGTYSLTVTFALGTDPNIDQVNVQNRVQIAEAQLPAEVQSEGITVRAASSTFVLAVNLYSPDKSLDQLTISNLRLHASAKIVARIPGVGNTQIFGEREYAMRVWLNPIQMTGLGISTAQVISAIEAQNVQGLARADRRAAGGRAISNSNSPCWRPANSPASSSSRTSSSGPMRAAASSTSPISRACSSPPSSTQPGPKLDNLPSATLAVYQAPDANALAVSAQVEKTVRRHGEPTSRRA